MEVRARARKGHAWSSALTCILLEECLIRPSSLQDNSLLDFFWKKKVQLGVLLPVNSTHV